MELTVLPSHLPRAKGLARAGLVLEMVLQRRADSHSFIDPFTHSFTLTHTHSSIHSLAYLFTKFACGVCAVWALCWEQGEGIHMTQVVSALEELSYLLTSLLSVFTCAGNRHESRSLRHAMCLLSQPQGLLIQNRPLCEAGV